jgi:hypothetical protein
MINKKAQGLSINAVILIVLGLAVLVVLIAGFLMGWDKIIPWFGEKNNVATVVSACETACSTSSLYNYCSSKRDMKSDDSKFQNITCYTLASLSNLVKYGVEKCPALDCKSSIICGEWYYVEDKIKINAKDKMVMGQALSDYCI